MRVAEALLDDPLKSTAWLDAELHRWIARGRAPLAIHSTAQLRALLRERLWGRGRHGGLTSIPAR